MRAKVIIKNFNKKFIFELMLYFSRIDKNWPFFLINRKRHFLHSKNGFNSWQSFLLGVVQWPYFLFSSFVAPVGRRKKENKESGRWVRRGTTGLASSSAPAAAAGDCPMPVPELYRVPSRKEFHPVPLKRETRCAKLSRWIFADVEKEENDEIAI